MALSCCPPFKRHQTAPNKRIVAPNSVKIGSGDCGPIKEKTPQIAGFLVVEDTRLELVTSCMPCISWNAISLAFYGISPMIWCHAWH